MVGLTLSMPKLRFCKVQVTDIVWHPVVTPAMLWCLISCIIYYSKMFQFRRRVCLLCLTLQCFLL